MNNSIRIDRLIREARAQRSAALGMALGEFLGNAWLAAVQLGRKVGAFAGRRQVRAGKTVAAR